MPIASQRLSGPLDEALARVLIVPGAGVQQYVRPVTEALALRGIAARLLPGPGQPAAPSDLSVYGGRLAAELRGRDSVELLVGLSVGGQAAAVAAASGDVRRLLLVSPTVDPEQRTAVRFVGRWAAAGRLEEPALFSEQLPEWRRAGARPLLAVVRSALRVRLEVVLSMVTSALAVVHAERDTITGHAFAAGLATQFGGRLVVVPQAVHSWPYGRPEQFADLVQDVLG